jgi:leucyl aminopeptidase (aminopeptidase T)
VSEPRSNIFQLIKGMQSMIKVITKIKPEDSVLVIADTALENAWCAQIITAALESMGYKPISITLPPPEFGKVEPPQPVAAAMKAANVTFDVGGPSSNRIHTTARREASTAGAKYYLADPPDTLDVLSRGISASDINLIKKRTERLARALRKAKIAKVTTPAGTNITMSVSGRESLELHPKGTVVSQLNDYAEAAIAPVEGTAEGTIVVDLGVRGGPVLIKGPLRLVVKSGKIVNVSGNAEKVDLLKKILATDENANNIAELGIGTSHIIPVEARDTARDGARLGTAHIGIGRNDDMGGKTWSAIHIDAMLDQATVELDGRCVLRDGTLFI